MINNINIISNDHIYKKEINYIQNGEINQIFLNFELDYSTLVYDNAQQISICPIILNGNKIDKYLYDILIEINGDPNDYFFISYSDTYIFNKNMDNLQIGMDIDSLSGSYNDPNKEEPYIVYYFQYGARLIIVPSRAGFLVEKNKYKVISYNIQDQDNINASEYVLMSRPNQYNNSQNTTWSEDKHYHINTIYTYNQEGYIISVSKLNKSLSFSKDAPLNIKITI